MSERTDADRLAHKMLDEPNTDPDDDLRLLSRQLLRRGEVIERLEKHLVELQDPTGDMINANRDSIMTKYEEAFARIRKCVKACEADYSGMRFKSEKQIKLIGKILDAAMSFHPMHGESWPGWPKEE